MDKNKGVGAIVTLPDVAEQIARFASANGPTLVLRRSWWLRPSLRALSVVGRLCPAQAIRLAYWLVAVGTLTQIARAEGAS